MKFNSFRYWATALAGSAFCFAAYAKPFIGKIYNSSAALDAEIFADVSATMDKTQKALPAMLRAIPGMKQAEKMTTISGDLEERGDWTFQRIEHYFTIKYVDPRIFPDSIVAIVEENKECAKKTDNPCFESHRFSFVAPAETYPRFVQGQNPVEPGVLADSLAITLTVTAIDDTKSRLALSLQVQNSRYQDYLRQLRVNRLLPRDATTREPIDPNEREIKSAFVMWANEALKTVVK